MQNLLILFNPYYQTDVIEQHLNLLIQNEKVAFGKIKSKLKNKSDVLNEELEKIYSSTTSKDYLQLFLTDYSNIYVAKVEKISSDDMSDFAPAYYKEKNLEVEQWFLITDIRELVRNNFETVRDDVLSNFIIPEFDNHSYAIYGNKYVYPLIVDMKEKIDYFQKDDEDFFYYPNMFKSGKYLKIKETLSKYSFGEVLVNQMHPNSIDSVISAEMEYEDNINNPIYDFSSVIVKYSKTMEQEIYMFAKFLVATLIKYDSKINNISYSVQGKDFIIKDIFENKPNLGTYKFLFRNDLITKVIENNFEFDTKIFVLKKFPKIIHKLQNIRNETVHGNAPDIASVKSLRANILGIAKESILIEIVKNRLYFKFSKTKLDSIGLK
jgi:hypothetical protein